jgi:pyridoxal phosphate enzyme (YggS family)
MIEAQIDSVRQRIQSACKACGRPTDAVTLLAVSKTFGPDAVQAAYRAGQSAFGENYIQEAVEKITTLRQLPLQWHCIGPIQSNKTRLVAEHFDWVHTVDRLKIAQRLSEQRPSGLPRLQVCIQVNVDGGATKSGIAPADVPGLAREVASLPRLHLRGLMCIPEQTPDFAAACAVFTRARSLFYTLNADGMALDTLSMGMSADLEAAIASGSTMVRVGSAIFGGRHYPTAGS